MDKNKEEKKKEEIKEEAPKKLEQEITNSVGDYLKTRREARGVSLKTVSKDTKISLTKLEFLEKNDFENLPNKIYVEGYIKSYAKSIGIRPDDCLKILHLTYQKSSLRRRLSLQEIPKENDRKGSRTSYAKISFTLLGLVFILLILLFFNSQKSSRQLSDARKDNMAPIQLKSVDTEASFKITPNKIIVENVQSSLSGKVPAQEGKNEVENDEVDKVEKKESLSEKKTKLEKQEADEKKIEFFPMKRSLYTIDTSVKPENLEKMIPQQIQRTLASGKQNIYIKASRGDSWISYKTDDKPVRNLTIKKDRDLLIKGKEVRIFFANIKAVDVFLNNKLLSISSSTGLKSVVFPQENRNKYVRPLFIYHDSGKVETSDEYLSRIQREGASENL